MDENSGGNVVIGTNNQALVQSDPASVPTTTPVTQTSDVNQVQEANPAINSNEGVSFTEIPVTDSAQVSNFASDVKPKLNGLDILMDKPIVNEEPKEEAKALDISLQAPESTENVASESEPVTENVTVPTETPDQSNVLESTISDNLTDVTNITETSNVTAVTENPGPSELKMDVPIIEQIPEVTQTEQVADTTEVNPNSQSEVTLETPGTVGDSAVQNQVMQVESVPNELPSLSSATALTETQKVEAPAPQSENGNGEQHLMLDQLKEKSLEDQGAQNILANADNSVRIFEGGQLVEAGKQVVSDSDTFNKSVIDTTTAPNATESVNVSMPASTNIGNPMVSETKVDTVSQEGEPGASLDSILKQDSDSKPAEAGISPAAENLPVAQAAITTPVNENTPPPTLDNSFDSSKYTLESLGQASSMTKAKNSSEVSEHIKGKSEFNLFGAIALGIIIAGIVFFFLMYYQDIIDALA